MIDDTSKKFIFGAIGLSIGFCLGVKVSRMKTESEVTEELYRIADKRVLEFRRKETENEKASEN